MIFHLILLMVLGGSICIGIETMWCAFKNGEWPFGIVVIFEVIGFILMTIFFIKEQVL
jgi:hypothetical protein